MKNEVDEKILEKIKEESQKEHVPIINDETLEYILEYVKNNKINVKKILEIGTATGYSSICFTKAFQGVEIETIERDENRFNRATKNIKELGLDNIDILYGDAIEILDKLDKQFKNENKEKYDLIFIDAAKSKYPIFLEYTRGMLKDDGVIFADNVLYKGYVLSDYNEHKQRTAVRNLREFLNTIVEDRTLISDLIEVGDGLAIIRFRKEK